VALCTWSQADALPSLPSLRRLAINISETPLENHQTLERNIRAFEQRMGVLRPNVEVNVELRSRSSSQSNREDRWFECIELASGKIVSLREAQPAVKIALLGDDLDLLRNESLRRSRTRVVDLSPAISNDSLRAGNVVENNSNTALETVLHLAPFSTLSFYRVLWWVDDGPGSQVQISTGDVLAKVHPLCPIFLPFLVTSKETYGTRS